MQMKDGSVQLNSLWKDWAANEVNEEIFPETEFSAGISMNRMV